MTIVIAVLAALLVLGVTENMLHRRALERIPIRILVNGTRGKTTVTRTIAAALNAAGIRTYAKTTGSEARRIDPDGTETEYRAENRPVSIMEQLPFVRLAVRGKAQAIVVECMAQRIENQFLMADKLIRPQYVVITNAYVDHADEIGRTEEETVHTLAQSIPEVSCVIAHDGRFGAYTREWIAPKEEIDLERFASCPFPVYEENIQLVLALTDALGIQRETAYAGILKTSPDIGMYTSVETGDCSIRNAFAANDAVSFGSIINAYTQPFLLLYNHRKDRGYRMEAFAKAIRQSAAKPVCIGVIGEHKKACARYMQRTTGIRAQAVERPKEWIQAQNVRHVLCAGNIKGEGRQFLEEMIEEARQNV